MILALRTFTAATDKEDIVKANALQDQVKVSQANVGSFDVPERDMDSLLRVRGALAVLASTVSDTREFFGDRSKLDPLKFKMGTAAGWGGNPKEAAIYFSHTPAMNDGKVMRKAARPKALADLGRAHEHKRIEPQAGQFFADLPQLLREPFGQIRQTRSIVDKSDVAERDRGCCSGHCGVLSRRGTRAAMVLSGRSGLKDGG